MNHTTRISTNIPWTSYQIKKSNFLSKKDIKLNKISRKNRVIIRNVSLILFTYIRIFKSPKNYWSTKSIHKKLAFPRLKAYNIWVLTNRRFDLVIRRRSVPNLWWPTTSLNIRSYGVARLGRGYIHYAVMPTPNV